MKHGMVFHICGDDMTLVLFAPAFAAPLLPIVRLRAAGGEKDFFRQGTDGSRRLFSCLFHGSFGFSSFAYILEGLP
jgi:hypothetical protein